MSLSVEVENNSAESIVVKVVGEVDFSTVDKVLEVIDEYRHTAISLDFSGIGFIDSTGVGLILRSVMELADTGGKVTITSVPQYIQEVLDEMGVSDILYELNGR